MDISFDIVMNDEKFVLYQNDKPVLTPAGNQVMHSNARLLRLAVAEAISGKPWQIEAKSLLMNLADVESNSKKALEFDVREMLNKDMLLQGNRMLKPALSGNLLHEKPELFNYIFHHSSSLASAWEAFLANRNPEEPLSDFILSALNELSNEQQVVLNELVIKIGSGVLIHLLLVRNFLSVTEYAAGLTICLLQENSNKDQEGDSPWENFLSIDSVMTEYGFLATNFLTLCKSRNQLSVIEEIIRRGEDDQTEFKSTLRWDLRQLKKSPDIEHASLKTICAFLNSEGGDLLIGVRDDGSLEGIETDQFENDDKFLLHLWMLIKTSMGHEVSEWVKTSIQKFGKRTVCRVHCKKSAKPVFLNHKGAETFYVRVGPASNSLEIRSALNYIGQHFT